MVEKRPEEISEDEAALYDRQIRLWGLDAQNRLRNASFLLAGLSGLGAEIAKNLMLAGLKHLTLMDHAEVSESDFRSQFLAPSDSVGKNRAEASFERCKQLNPMVEVVVDREKVERKSQSFFQKFDLVCLVDQQKETVQKVNKLCREAGVKFCAGGVYGWIGFCFLDLIEHEFVDEEVKKEEVKEDDVETILDLDEDEPPSKKPRESIETVPEHTFTKQKEYFLTFEDVVNAKWNVKSRLGRGKKLPHPYFIVKTLWTYEAKNGSLPKLNVSGVERGSGEGDEGLEEELLKEMEEHWKSVLDELVVKPGEIGIEPKDFVKYVSGEVNPVCAIVGGVLGQEIIKALSQKDRPINNMFFYSGLDSSGVVAKIPPPLVRTS